MSGKGKISAICIEFECATNDIAGSKYCSEYVSTLGLNAKLQFPPLTPFVAFIWILMLGMMLTLLGQYLTWDLMPCSILIGCPLQFY